MAVSKKHLIWLIDHAFSEYPLTRQGQARAIAIGLALAFGRQFIPAFDRKKFWDYVGKKDREAEATAAKATLKRQAHYKKETDHG